jgi:hypothetical protein
MMDCTATKKNILLRHSLFPAAVTTRGFKFRTSTAHGKLRQILGNLAQYRGLTFEGGGSGIFKNP